jgi:1-acyl-sn-glycerol-3-phosphate acyltransferase
MSVGWVSPDPYPVTPPPSAMGWLRIVVRGVPLVILVFGGLVVLLVVRQIERPVWGGHRPWTPFIVQFVCRGAMWLLRIKLVRKGQIMPYHGALVANHSSWLDIFVLNACTRVYFVSKAEVAGWFGIGWLARATGTVFIERKREQAAKQREQLAARLDIGHRLLFFPEGTSTDGHRVLPFKSTLFEALYAVKAKNLWVQPVTVKYHAPAGSDPRFFGWWGEMEFAPHLLMLLASGKTGQVDVTFHAPVSVDETTNRKALATMTGETVRNGMVQSLGPADPVMG